MIELTFSNYRCFGDAPQTIRIDPGVTAFLGPNNAGKSTVLRLLRDLRPVFERPHGNASTLEDHCRETKRCGEYFTRVEEGWWHTLCDRNEREFQCRVASLDPHGEGPEFSFTCRRQPEREAVVAVQLRQRGGREYIDVPEGHTSGTGSWKHAIESIQAVLKDLASTVFVGPFRNVLNVEGVGTQHFDMTIGRPLVEGWHVLKNGTDPDHARIAARLERQIAGLLCLKSLEINSARDFSTLLVVVGEHRYELGDMGTGTAHLITVLANLALARPAYVLIDEPEAGLHPRLQMRFVETLQQLAGRGVIMATHSVGLARASAQRIYTIRVAEEERSIHRFEGTPSLAAFMGEMSFSSYRDLGYDRLLLVEGPTDMPVIRHFLRLLSKDHQVVLLPVRGDEGIAPHTERELEEVKRICPNVSAVIDSDKGEAEPLGRNRQGFVDACAAAGVRCHVLARRSIENYFADAAVKVVLGDKATALGPYETTEEAGWKSLGYSKRTHNWRIADAMTFTDLGGDLAEFLKGA